MRGLPTLKRWSTASASGKRPRAAVSSLDTAFRWRHRFLASAKDVQAKTVKGIVEADETFIRKSAKGSKRLVGRAPQKARQHCKIRALQRRLCAGPDRARPSRRDADQVLPDLEGATFKRVLDPVVAPDALLVSDGRAAYGQFADDAGLLHIALNASAGERTYGSYHIQNVNAYISRLKHWLRRFKGVATHYLPSYLGWRRMIEREPISPAAISSTPCLMPQLESRTEPKRVAATYRNQRAQALDQDNRAPDLTAPLTAHDASR